MYSILNQILFATDPEWAHDFTISFLSKAGKIFGPSAPLDGRIVKFAGLEFKNAIGLAAGLDKNAVAISGLSMFGFGHIEVGTVTPKPQSGNSKPRLFRLVEDRGLINRFGFNNDGIDVLAKRLDAHPFKGILGVNIGKNKTTSNDEAARDYLICLKRSANVCDYVTVNVSSPNTPGLRNLASADKILDLIKPLIDCRHNLRNRRGGHLPLFVKLSPDFGDDDLCYVLEALVSNGIDGVVLTNTTVERVNLNNKNRKEAGGLSGAPLAPKSEHCLRVASKYLSGSLPIISAGGIMSPDCCLKRLKLGASLVQIYSGVVYNGPKFVRMAIEKTKR